MMKFTIMNTKYVCFWQIVLSGFVGEKHLTLASAMFRHIFPSIDANTVSPNKSCQILILVERTRFPAHYGLDVNVSGETFFMPENTVASLQQRHKAN